jgi:flagellar biogenesis protein FliO
MAYEPQHSHEPAPVDPDRGSATGFAAIKYTAIIIIVLAILAFLAWVLIRFIG